MNRFITMFSSGLLLGASVLGVGAMPVAAQPAAGCSLVSDDVLSQAVGTPTHAMSFLSGGVPTAADRPAIADMCFAQVGNQHGLMLTHMVGVQTQGDVKSMQSATQGATAALSFQADTGSVTATPISDLGDSAVLISGGAADKSYANLIVWRGTEAYSIVGDGLPDAQYSLRTLAQAILGGQPAPYV